jgi:hypothetical protein
MLADFAAEIAAGRVVVIEIAGAVGGTWFGRERGLARAFATSDRDDSRNIILCGSTDHFHAGIL